WDRGVERRLHRGDRPALRVHRPELGARPPEPVGGQISDGAAALADDRMPVSEEGGEFAPLLGLVLDLDVDVPVQPRPVDLLERNLDLLTLEVEHQRLRHDAILPAVTSWVRPTRPRTARRGTRPKRSRRSRARGRTGSGRSSPSPPRPRP